MSRPKRQAKMRGDLTLLGHAFALHDIDDLERHMRSDLDLRLKEKGAFLQGYEYEDALSYFIGRAWELSLTYDSNRGWSFSKLCRDRSRWWYTDFLRQRHGDSRYGQNIIPESLRDEDRRQVAAHVIGPDVLEMVNTALLSPEARRTFEWFAWPHFVEQRPIAELAEYRGQGRKEVKMRLESMAAELQAKCFAEAA